MTDDRELLREMGRLLLAGAKMLDETCPKCGTPLFLMKDVGLRYCPKCKVYYATPEDVRKGKLDDKRFKIYDYDEYWRIVEGGKLTVPKAEAEMKGAEESAERENKKHAKKEAKEHVEASLSLEIRALQKLMATVASALANIVEEKELSYSELLDILERIARVLRILREKP